MKSNMKTAKSSKTIDCQTNESEEDRPPSNNRNGRHRSQKGPATDPQSVYARVCYPYFDIINTKMSQKVYYSDVFLNSTETKRKD